MKDAYTLYFDGSCGPKNPGGTAGYGFVLFKNGEEIARDAGVVGSGPLMSNNVGEYYALHAGLMALLIRHELNVGASAMLFVRGDSQLVIRQMSGKWKAKGGLYLPYYQQAKQTAKELFELGVRIQYDWIPREQNTTCDELSKECV